MSLKSWIASVGLVSVATVSAASAAPFVYNDFSSTAGLQLNASAAAATDGSGRRVLRVTPSAPAQAGSAFSTSVVSLSNAASFSTFFNFNLNTSAGIGDGDGTGADGFVFVVQPNSNTAGGNGGGIGYAGIPNSLGIEFDTYNNGEPGGGNHVGVDINGSVNSVTSIAVAPRLNNGADWSAWVDYNGGSQVLEVRLAQGLNALRPVAALITHSINLAAVLGTPNAFVGFTSGTGAGYNNHDIISWAFNEDFAPIGAPAPGALSLLGLALLGLGALKRRGPI